VKGDGWTLEELQRFSRAELIRELEFIKGEDFGHLSDGALRREILTNSQACDRRLA
jgi:hypothetical protein